jgi:predicted anti-sigma-YlaC factor YlaD
MLRCREVTRLHASDELARASLWTRLGVGMHLAMCRHCRRYVRELARIREAVGALYRDSSEQPERDEAMVRRVMAGGDERPPD